MPNLHIVHGGIENGDKRLLMRVAKTNRKVSTWVLPKSAKAGDRVVIYITGFGFFATASIQSDPVPRTDWKRRYGAPIAGIKLISPAISLAQIRKAVPGFKWTNYPRSITTPPKRIAKYIETLIRNRAARGYIDYEEDAIAESNLDELRLLAERGPAGTKKRTITQRVRSLAIKQYALTRARGICEGCGSNAPFCTTGGNPYLEPHHMTRLADDGPDHPENVISLCPTCHRRAHYSADGVEFNEKLKTKVVRIENRLAKH